MSKWRMIKSFSLPCSAILIIPAIILHVGGRHAELPWFSSVEWHQYAIGGALIFAGALLMISTISMFASTGSGTLAPWDPTQKLVVKGVYRRARNPMITGVFFILAGETAIFRSEGLLCWTLIFFALNTVWFKVSEEPGLVKRFGADYIEYRKNVPMWIPRIKPWSFESPEKNNPHR